MNGKAVAIECFLDLSRNAGTPAIRWTSFNHNMGAYQGELVDKEEFTRAFFAATCVDLFRVKKIAAIGRVLPRKRCSYLSARISRRAVGSIERSSRDAHVADVIHLRPELASKIHALGFAEERKIVP